MLTLVRVRVRVRVGVRVRIGVGGRVGVGATARVGFRARARARATLRPCSCAMLRVSTRVPGQRCSAEITPSCSGTDMMSSVISRKR